MFDKVLIANRGEIACRILRTLKGLNVRSVAVYSDADRDSPHVAQADEAVRLGAGPAGESYLRQDRLLAAARASGAEAIHPGYGFLSENADFAAAAEAAGIVFIGPSAAHIKDFGLKHRARELARLNGVPLLPGSGLLEDVAQARGAALRIGYPVMLKSSAGGGGIGMQLVRHEAELAESFEAVQRLAGKNFGGGGVFLEKYVERARHVEVQIFGDGAGGVIALGERDCSAQRRHQKLIEETPAPGLTETVRQGLFAAALRLGRAVSYRSAGTVEFVLDASTQQFYFLEVNTRLQVEHGITEEVTGIDLVEWMVRLAAGERWTLVAPSPRGAALEVRIYAEDPMHQFRPSAGLLTHVRFDPTSRIETWVQDGTRISPLYDPLLAKLITVGADRDEALARMRAALSVSRISGIETNLDYLRQLIADPVVGSGAVTTRSLDEFAYSPRTVEVLAAGTQTTVQDYPGRIGFWNVGVPPSGPMDDLSFRLANRAVGNRPGAAALELTVSGPTLKFNAAATICLAGAPMAAEAAGRTLPFGVPITIEAGQTLRMGGIRGAGSRTYLAVRGGFDVPLYMGSCATFTLGGFGGHGGRALLPGDVLHLSHVPVDLDEARPIPPDIMPALLEEWELGVLSGPHGAPDFFTDGDMQEFFATCWEVHYNSSRTGVRLLGWKPQWARSDGGEAGLHPSNIHDNAYAIGSVDFTGDMPVILGPDGPSLGGFVCPATLVKSELWKLGQLRPGNRVRFKALSAQSALEAERAQEEMLKTLRPPPTRAARQTPRPDGPILAALAAGGTRPAVVYRRAGDRNLLVEYGPLVLDLELRLRVHALMLWLQATARPGILGLTPGIRSLQVHHDPRVLPLERLLELLQTGEESLAAIDDMEIATRTVRLPLSWDDESTRLAIAKYMQSVRADAPWCPSNIEFIRRINGLDSIEEVRCILFEATYVVLGLGDVYLGAPVTTPLDPRHRLVTTKYNPARTWTPENAVGIGGAYLCVYGMEGPGGYQFVGRTCQMWNTYHVTREFTEGKPWLLRFFDQIRFHPVSHAELQEFRADFLHGRARLDIRDDVFRLRDYRRFLAENAWDITQHKARQQAAFLSERARWEATGQIGYASELPPPQAEEESPPLEAGCLAVPSPVSGSVWKIASAAGQAVKAGDPLVWVESMKMELAVEAPVDGVVTQLCCTEGRAVLVAQTLLILRPNDSGANA